MGKLKISFLGSALLTGAAFLASSAAYAGLGDRVINFDSTAVGVPTPAVSFSYDEFGISPFGPQNVTQLDTDNNGVLSAGDGFSEMSLFFTNSFSQGGFPLTPQPGQGTDFQILSDVDLNGSIAFGPGGALIINFTSATGIQTIQDINPVAGATATLANISLGGASQCVITAPFSGAQGSCKLFLNFAPTAAGLFVTSDGVDLFGNDTSLLEVDINVNDLAGLSGVFAGFGTTCGAGTEGGLCEQNLLLTHDGSAIHQVPEPGSLALLGLGLLGLAGTRLKKARS